MTDKGELPWVDRERLARMDAGEIEADIVDRRKFRFLAVAVLLLVGVLICVGAFASRADAAEPPTIPQLAAMPERDFVRLILDCRSTTRYADTHTCRNAEHAFELRYAEALRRDRLAMMRSPLFWVNNRASAFNVLRACDAGEEWARKWCGVVRSVYGKAT